MYFKIIDPQSNILMKNNYIFQNKNKLSEKNGMIL